jgi:hypothetical protein
MKASPPKGVTAPQRGLSVSASRYRLPEKSSVPAIKSQPARGGRALEGYWREAKNAASSAKAWYIW